MDNSQEKIGFFKRIKIAVFKLEEYGFFLGERLSKSFKYFFLLILLLTVVMVAAGAYDFYNMLNTGFSYVKNELPEFSYSDGSLKFERNVEAYDRDYEFKLYINTDDDVSNETLTSYKDDIYSVQDGIILLKDKVIYITQGNSLENTYEKIINMYNLNISNKQDFVNLIDSVGVFNIVIIYAVSSFISAYLINVIYILLDLVVIAAFGYVASRICGIKFKVAPMITLSIYSLTLSIILTGIYNVVLVFTGFVIKYFEIMYLLIAYVYIIAAIFMIKYDLIKQTEELQKIIEVQKQVKKDAEERLEEKEKEKTKEEEKEEEENKKDNKEDSPVEVPKEDNKEPDGSEI